MDLGGLNPDIPALVRRLRGRSAVAQLQAAQALEELAEDAPDNNLKAAILLAGGVEALVSLLHSSRSEALQAAAAAALSELAVDFPAGQAAAGTAGALPALVQLLAPHRGEAAHGQAASALVARSYRCPPNKQIIEECGGVEALAQQLCSDSSFRLLMQDACSALANLLSDSTTARAVLAASGAVPVLVRCLSHSSVGVLQPAARASWCAACTQVAVTNCTLTLPGASLT